MTFFQKPGDGVALATKDSLSLSLSLSHTHTHTVPYIPDFAILLHLHALNGKRI